MENWQKDFMEVLEVAANEVEQFFTEITQVADEIIDSFLVFSEEVNEQVQNTIIPELDQFFNELVEPVVEVFFEFERSEDINHADLFVHYVEPTEEKNSACRGCQNYHGQVYGGNLMVCGMHPYGWDGDSCPDWQSY
ncbi:MAG TPA: hypothetical protein V6D13_10125 [Halomicronema sp.]